MPKKKERQKTLKESQQKKGIKIPFLVILFLIVFGVSFLVNLLNNNSSNKRGDYMDVKYINKEPEPDPFQKPDVPANGGGGQGYQSGVDDPLLYSKIVFGVSFWAKQREIVMSVWNNKKTAVKASH